MNHLEERVRRAIEDLSAIHGDLLSLHGKSDASDNKDEIDIRLAREFKSMVDTLRTLLWCHLSAPTNGSKKCATQKAALESFRLYRAADLVRSHAVRQTSSLHQST